jgi:hypothetical protein
MNGAEREGCPIGQALRGIMLRELLLLAAAAPTGAAPVQLTGYMSSL